LAAGDFVGHDAGERGYGNLVDGGNGISGALEVVKVGMMTRLMVGGLGKAAGMAQPHTYAHSHLLGANRGARRVVSWILDQGHKEDWQVLLA
jgi:hypothetical protein